MNAMNPKFHRSSVSKWIAPAHKRVAKCIGFALNIGTASAWEGLSVVLLARLTPAERAALAYSALITLDDDTAYRTASVALHGVMDGEVLS